MMANRTRSHAMRSVLAAALLVAAACESPIAERILEVEQKGAVLVFLFRDDNVNGVFNGGTDLPVADGLYGLRTLGELTDAIKARTDTAGFSLAAVPPGRYRVNVEATVLGDTLEVVTGSREFTIAAQDTVRQNVGVAYKTVTPTAARALPQGRRVWLSGVALNAPGAFGDSTVHVADGQFAIRALAVRPAAMVAGDSVVFLGRVTVSEGQPAFDVTTQIVRGIQQVPVLPDSVTTNTAATAGGGPLDARLVRVFDAVIADTATDPAGNRVLGVNDGSGRLRVILSRNNNWAPLNQFVVGARLRATGVLVPEAGPPAVWVLKPRARTDLLVF